MLSPQKNELTLKLKDAAPLYKINISDHTNIFPTNVAQRVKEVDKFMEAGKNFNFTTKGKDGEIRLKDESEMPSVTFASQGGIVKFSYMPKMQVIEPEMVDDAGNVLREAVVAPIPTIVAYYLDPRTKSYVPTQSIRFTDFYRDYLFQSLRQ